VQSRFDGIGFDFANSTFPSCISLFFPKFDLHFMRFDFAPEIQSSFDQFQFYFRNSIFISCTSILLSKIGLHFMNINSIFGVQSSFHESQLSSRNSGFILSSAPLRASALRRRKVRSHVPDDLLLFPESGRAGWIFRGRRCLARYPFVIKTFDKREFGAIFC
jgi:hypothetical protein